MHPSIIQVSRSLIGNAVANAQARATEPEVSSALLAGLGLLRRIVGEEAGYTAQKTFDDYLRQHLLSRGLDHLKNQRTELRKVALPDAASSSSPAQAIITDAVFSSMTLNLYAPGNDYILAAAAALLDSLCERIGGLPDYAELIRKLTEDEEGLTTGQPQASVPWLN
ncbi:hypothetical protein [Telmatospirillum sp. J64-1]|uniref:hypothetical protein n=1 Tax=Telmatospirillum sp. J64-1 TaxID=2502183 RepID=UPI00115F5CD7|nr:hypothetical protein [Telmatospirillum sp. J64-1]